MIFEINNDFLYFKCKKNEPFPAGFACSSQWMLETETSCPLISLKQLTTRVAVPCPQFAEQTPHSLAAHFD